MNFKKFINHDSRIHSLNFFKKLLNKPELDIIEGAAHGIKWGQHCEHLYYHFSAIKNNNAKIKLAKDIL